MSVINDLVSQIDNKELRVRIENELARMANQKKFGLVFEEHLPECTPLYDIPVKRGSLVALKAGKINDVYSVVKIDGTIATCIRREDKSVHEHHIDSIVPVAEFGDPIYPYLKPIDTVCNAPDSDLWHTLIEADNYHALQLMEYLYAGKVDCIYIDPPYNTGARDWKYNNDYVDGSDSYRHSKWLSFLQKRLKIAKRLLNPKDSVLIVTIDEKEYLHLGCLLEELFPESNMQMVSSVINPAGVSRGGEFARTNEYIFFVYIGECRPAPMELGESWIGEIKSKKRKFSLRWNTLLRSGTNARRVDRPNLFYPIFVSDDGNRIVDVGRPLPLHESRESISPLPGTKIIWPIRSSGEEGNWQVDPSRVLELLEKGYIKLGRFNDRGTIAIDYLKKGEIAKIEDGTFDIMGYSEGGTIIVDDSDYAPIFVPGCQWNIPSHDATQQGTKVLNAIIGNRFNFPKSVYAVQDALRFFTINKPNALIVDFFAGSGTTLHAVNLLNAEDGGHRRCIMVTNNEVSADEAKSLSARGYQPGDAEWNKLGIARYVTWPRTVCSIEGHDVNGNPLKGNYLGSDLPMADGFKANAAFFKLGFLDKNAVALGMQFKEMIPVLWMKAGAFGPCPSVSERTPGMLVLPENRFAVLIDEREYTEFLNQLDQHPEVQTVYIVTDSEAGYRDMISHIDGKQTFQLYRDYLDNFRINSVRR